MRTLTIVAALLLVPTLAAAQPAPPSPASTAAPKARVITITDGDTIDGDRPSGELMPLSARANATSGSLLRIRRDFIDLILKTAEEV
ncbi:MAG: hypothetical protein R3B06_01640 [Kofleriaceae bacterium]